MMVKLYQVLKVDNEAWDDDFIDGRAPLHWRSLEVVEYGDLKLSNGSGSG